ncbi:MAG TPA: 30S ribosomal protein S4 [Kiritimatiellia bacterium]|nr:30S ribosomal protein S4 [Kiritimatiellia bacterium]HNR93211.1 30S ribosomal protein S4 [Kiritimatiellia bacterium]HNS81179.1 30S ribosomal protein S4 [Kiritimatiellia bacterium]HPA77584.1 30S ribosomal protein S4 [Kiritimatiellia bacterium]HQQ03622.1 30S ribosomal protein S4 [Kiritimatiellia bacterium]
MGRYTGPACKQCRREQMKLFLKGERCFMAKCPIETGRPQPGGAGRRRKKTSDYGNQLREKQRLRRMFGLREGQFHNFFERAAKKRGITGETLLQMLELRVDNLVYRLGFAPSRRAARQFVRHGHVRVNGERANIPSMILKPGDSITVKDAKDSREYASKHMDQAEARGIVPWMSLDKNNFKGEVLHVPTRDEMAPLVDEQLVVELYSK